ncbi:hypothetical protein FACS1894208_03990 [Clostridia bacterium]|nr:hypothetical protein FACS1894208_03990 [Clostridia bacterium]
MSKIRKRLTKMSPLSAWILRCGLILSSALLLTATALLISNATHESFLTAEALQKMTVFVLFVAVFGSAYAEQYRA